MNFLSYTFDKVKSFINIGWVLCSFLLVLGACIDKDIEISGQDISHDADEDELVLKFPLNLAEDSSTRADGDVNYENYIDFDNKFQILFFDAAGDFLFEAKNFQTDKTADNNDYQWLVTIHLTNDMQDRKGTKIPLSSVKNALEAGTFKIAALANWGSNQQVEWGMGESKFTTNSPKNVNDLHRLTIESQYEPTDKDPKEYYNFLRDKKGDMKLGYRVSWVDTKLNYSSLTGESKREVAEKLIRQYWNPNLEFKESGEEVAFLSSHYSGSNLWQVWNFGGSFDDNVLTYNDIARKDDSNLTKIENSNKWSSEWNTRNGDNLEKWLTQTETKNETTNVLKSIIGGENTFDGVGEDGLDGFIFVQADSKGVLSTSYNEGGWHGIALGKTSYTTKKEGDNYDYLNWSSNDIPQGYIKIKAYGSGILRVLWRSENNNSGAKLYVQRGTTYVTNTGTQNNTDLQQIYKTIDITGNPEDIYIYNVNSGKAIIYSIEFICDKYLNATDNQGRPVSADNLIPMYGIQNYEKITTWGEGKVIDLSASGKRVDLIRSVAKVEVYFNPSHTPKHIYMRSMNSSSRNEPMDVFNPTWNSWTKGTSINAHDENHCEFFDIQKHGALYSNYITNKYPDFDGWFQWFFYNMLDHTANEDSDNGDSGSTSTFHPHVFNPMVLRSDFCRFIDCGIDSESGMYKYLLYLPEKNIDDPNNAGVMSETPKVPHIEYRYEKHSDYLDDNKCYRIYFTNYSTNNDIKRMEPEDFDNFELNIDTDGTSKNFLDNLWPIMRNHIYRFYINSNNETEEIRVHVNDWGDQDAKRVEW